MIKQVFWGISEYLFGAGNDDFYYQSMETYDKIDDEFKRKVERYSTLADKVSKVVLRTACTALSTASIIAYIRTKDVRWLGILGLNEGFLRQLSIQFEKRNIKKLEDEL